MAVCAIACAHTASKPLLPPVSSREHDVVAAVVESLATDRQCDHAGGAIGIAVNQYMISARDLESDAWLAHALGADAWREVAPLMPVLRMSTTTDHRVDWLLPEGRDVRNRDLSSLGDRERSELEGSVRCFATFMQPVFSADATRALVVLHIGPSPHGALAIYALQFAAKRWEIAAHRIIDFI